MQSIQMVGQPIPRGLPAAESQMAVGPDEALGRTVAAKALMQFTGSIVQDVIREGCLLDVTPHDNVR